MPKKTEEFKRGYKAALRWVKSWYGPDHYDMTDLINEIDRKLNAQEREEDNDAGYK